ncbi:hypothetical protein [uncultured Amphritea sp.]|uniref:hypothetical protein n=1 Tax=uncultured Amphritea sp. TaxID=981605 RepID=UPI0025EDB95B|nr:hypothetical protein [uncultured Amphritea sp.]
MSNSPVVRSVEQLEPAYPSRVSEHDQSIPPQKKSCHNPPLFYHNGAIDYRSADLYKQE